MSAITDVANQMDSCTNHAIPTRGPMARKTSKRALRAHAECYKHVPLLLGLTNSVLCVLVRMVGGIEAGLACTQTQT